MLGPYQPFPGYGRLLPADTTPLHPSSLAGWLLTGYAGGLAVLVAVPWAVWTYRKRRDVLPMLILAAGVLASFGEAQLDLAGHLRWAPSLPGPVWTIYGLHVPAVAPPAYVWFMGLLPYWVYLVLKRGCTTRQFCWMAFTFGLVEGVTEFAGLGMHTYEYYGSQPFKFGGFPSYWAFTNAAAICTVGVMVYVLWPMVVDRGWRRLAVLPVGLVGVTIAEFGTGFPTFLAINAQIPSWLEWMIGALTYVVAVAWIRLLAEFAAREETATFSLWDVFLAKLRLGGASRGPLLDNSPALERS